MIITIIDASSDSTDEDISVGLLTTILFLIQLTRLSLVKLYEDEHQIMSLAIRGQDGRELRTFTSHSHAKDVGSRPGSYRRVYGNNFW